MTTFTDDLDNDLEVLAEHHEVTPVQVAKAAFAQVPEYVRSDLLRSLLDVQQQLDEKSLNLPKEGHALPLALRATIHGLVQRFPGNLVVDAAMLELPQGVRTEVARAFLPKEPENVEQPPRAKPGKGYHLVDTKTGETLIITDSVVPQIFDFVAEDGTRKHYIRRPGDSVLHEFTADGQTIVKVLFYSPEPSSE